MRAYIPGLSFIREFVNFAKKSEKEGSANYFGSVAAVTETDFPAGDARRRDYQTAALRPARGRQDRYENANECSAAARSVQHVGR